MTRLNKPARPQSSPKTPELGRSQLCYISANLTPVCRETKSFAMTFVPDWDHFDFRASIDTLEEKRWISSIIWAAVIRRFIPAANHSREQCSSTRIRNSQLMSIKVYNQKCLSSQLFYSFLPHE